LKAESEDDLMPKLAQADEHTAASSTICQAEMVPVHLEEDLGSAYTIEELSRKRGVDAFDVMNGQFPT
jgi:hypothetical protein